MKDSQIVVSVSMALAATNALASMGDATIKLPEKEGEIPPEVAARINDVMSSRSMQDATAKNFVSISSILVDEEGASIMERFLPDGLKLAYAPGQQDSTDLAGTCYGNCYGNCHSNCHGSRGWR